MATLTTHKTLFDPSGPTDSAWQHAPALTLTTVATPQAMQSAEYLQRTYKDGEWGHIKSVQVQGWQNRHALHLRLQFASTHPYTQFLGPDHFLDRAAVFFPLHPSAHFMTMGNEQGPGLIWAWRSDGKVEALEARGPGTIKSLSNEGLRVQSRHTGDHWQVQISGPQISNSPRQFALAVWSGAGKERGGLKSVTTEWIELDSL